ncbi:T9SS type A sorting domain-containing protein [Spirosoma arcticum]
MKTLIKPLFLALSLTFITASLSEAKPGRQLVATYKTGIYSTVTGKLQIALDKQAGGSVTVQLKDSDGQLLYSQHLGKKETSFRTRLNVDELPDGNYVLEITNGVETTRQTITLKTKQSTAANRIVQTDFVAGN